MNCTQKRLSDMEVKLKVADGKAVAGAAAGGGGSGAEAWHTPWGPSEARDKTDPELAAVLRKVGFGNCKGHNRDCTEPLSRVWIVTHTRRAFRWRSANALACNSRPSCARWVAADTRDS